MNLALNIKYTANYMINEATSDKIGQRSEYKEREELAYQEKPWKENSNGSFR